MLTAVAVVAGALGARALVAAARRAEAGTALRHLRLTRPWRLPEPVRGRLARALDDAALAVDPEAVCELWLASTAGGAVPAFALSPALGVLTVVGGLAGGPVALLVARGRARRRLVAALPAMLEQVAAGLRGGASVPEAVEAAAADDGPLAPDLHRVRARAGLGTGLADALARWAGERPLPEVRAACGALAVAASVGGPAAGALEGLARSLRDRLAAVAEARAQSAQARVSAIVVGTAPLAYLAFAAVADPASLRLLVDTGAGRVCLVLGLACELAGVFVMRRIVREETE